MGRMPVIIPAQKAHSHTVIFLHGRGDDADFFSASLKYSHDSRNRTLHEAFPTFRLVFPKSNETLSFSARGNKVSQWFDNWNVEDYSDREEIQTLGLKERINTMQQILAIEAGILGERAAFVGFSCRMPFPERALAETRKMLNLDDVLKGNQVIRKTPVLLQPCADDEVVPVEHGRVLRDMLQGFGAQVHWREYPTGGNWLHLPTGMDVATEYLTHVLDESPSSTQPSPGTGGGTMNFS